MVRDLELDVPCKNRKAGCGHKAAEKKLVLHEDECRYRTVSCPLGWFVCSGYVQFQHLIDHLKEKHGLKEKINKWALANDFKDGSHNLYKSAYKFETGPGGKLFCTGIVIKEGGEKGKELFLYGSVRVMGGKQEAKKYRAQFRVSSNDTTVNLTHSGPVFSVDEFGTEKECFEMSAYRFESFNHGQKYFGDHNKDKNGEYVLPIQPKIIKKGLALMSTVFNQPSVDVYQCLVPDMNV